MGRKGKRGDDSDDDAGAAVSKPATKGPADGGGKKGKKGRDDDDDDVATLSSKVKAVSLKGGDDDDAGGKGKKAGKGKGRDDDDDKKGKSRKGRADSDDDDSAAHVKGKKGKAAGSDDEAEGKGRKKKGRRGDDSDDDDTRKHASKKSAADDDEDKSPVKGKRGKSHAKHDDDDDEDHGSGDEEEHAAHSKSKPTTAAPPKPAGGKKKKGKKGKHDDDDDDDDDIPDPLAMLSAKPKGRLAALSSSDEDEPATKKAPKEAPKRKDDEDAPKPVEAQGKKGKKGRRQEEDLADFLPGLAAPTSTAEVPAAVEPEKPEEAIKEPAVDASADHADDTLLADKKKKKKKVVLVEPEPETDSAPVAAETAAYDVVPSTEATPSPQDGEVAAGAGEEGDLVWKPKKKKKAVVLAESDALPEETPAEAEKPAEPKPESKPAASEAAPFYGEASMGGNSADVEGLDIPPEVAKVLAKASRGEALSNKERRLKKAWEEDQAKLAPVAAGYGDTHKGKPGDEYGIAAFTVSSAAKLMALDSAAAENAKDIMVENFTITAHKKELFKNADLKIAHGHRYGLVGPNGQGKTTILKHIAARELPIPPRISVLYVEQEVIADDTPAVQAVLKADKRRSNLLTEEKQLLDALERADADEERGVVSLNEAERGKKEERLAAIYDELAAMRADASESSARKILSGLGFTPEMQEQPTKHFSGGWRMRISLARALFMQPDLLLLDEPTNHLDLNAVIWLEDYLKKWKNTLLVVSHDQDFLSAVVTDIIHLEEKKLWYYKGNYDDFKEMHAQKVQKQMKDYEKQQKMLKSMKDKGATNKDAKDKALSRAKREIAATGRKDKRGGGGEDYDDEGGKGRELILKPKEYTVRFTFNDPPELAPPILSVSDMGFRYGERYPWLFRDVNCGIDQSSRVAIVGPNGVGKSTFLSLLIGDLMPTVGDVTRNRFLRIGKYSQHFVDVLPMDKSPVEYLQSKFTDLGYQEARSLLGRFGLEGHAHTIPNSELSGGQKARVVFASLCLEAPHVMVLDEPSNNLDAESIDALADAISKFEGGVVLVSHDARLIREADCLLWVCDKQNVKPFDGDLEDYKASLLEVIHKEEEELEAAVLKRMNEELEAKLAATRERHLKLKAMREAKKTSST